MAGEHSSLLSSFHKAELFLIPCQNKARTWKEPMEPFQLNVHLVVRMLSWGAPRATLLVLTGGDAAVVRGVGADRGMPHGTLSPSRCLVARPNT